MSPLYTLICVVLFAVNITTTAGQNSTTTSAAQPSSTTPSAGAGLVPVNDPTSEAAQGKYNVTSSDNKTTCIRSVMGVRLGFTYLNSANQTVNIAYDIPVNDTKVTGNCNETEQELKVTFATSWVYLLHFTLEKDQWAVDRIQVTFDVDSKTFPGSTQSGIMDATYNASAEYQTSNGSSYQCVSKNPVSGFMNPDDFTVNVTTYKLQLEAFRDSPPTQMDFSPPVPCPADTEVSNIVPIAVGAALAGLVVIVLIAYLIGRKKNKQGYESV